MAKRRKKAVKKAPVKRVKKAGRPRKTPASLTNAVSGAVTNLKSALDVLLAERARLDEQISAIQQALTAVGTPVAVTPAAKTKAPKAAKGKRGGRGRRSSGSLKEYIENVLTAAGDVMAVKDIADEVVAAGYASSNKTLAKSVGVALTQMKNVKKVGRGQFKLK